ncbi:MAG: hypothetical protein JRH07_12830 [Deltaproteobacteria bacterium]|nr:hypothetical protein [Deltaproteobacteria bacterium]MBW2122708.1 hypothetical protein [Deltaproteobacteria bacterium]
MNLETLKREIEELPRGDKVVLLTQVMPVLCRELLGDEACREQMKEVFGIDCVRELAERFEAAV